MRLEAINRLTRDEALSLMRSEGLPVEFSMFATIHHRSEERPIGWTEDELEKVSGDLADADLLRWRAELSAHFRAKS